LEAKDGKVSIEYRGKLLTVIPYGQMQSQAKVVSSKELMCELTERATAKSQYKPIHKHPWKSVAGVAFPKSLLLLQSVTNRYRS
jgi:hypothetical protein